MNIYMYKYMHVYILYVYMYMCVYIRFSTLNPQPSGGFKCMASATATPVNAESPVICRGFRFGVWIGFEPATLKYLWF